MKRYKIQIILVCLLVLGLGLPAYVLAQALPPEASVSAPELKSKDEDTNKVAKEETADDEALTANLILTNALPLFSDQS